MTSVTPFFFVGWIPVTVGDLDAAKTVDQQMLPNVGAQQVGGGAKGQSKATTMTVFTKQCGRNFMRMFSKKLLHLVGRLHM